MVSDVDVVAASGLTTCEAVDETDPAKKRKRTMVDPDVEDWFLDYHECLKVKHKWNTTQSWRRGQEMLPSLLKDVHQASVDRWTHSDCAKNKAGREWKLNIAHLTLLGQMCNNLVSQVALTSRTYQMIFAAELEKPGVHWMPCRRWVRRFLGARSHKLQETWRRCHEGAWAWSVYCVHGNSLTLYTVLLWSVALSSEGCGFFLLCAWNNQERNGCRLHRCRLVFSRDWLVLVLRKKMPQQRLGALRA